MVLTNLAWQSTSRNSLELGSKKLSHGIWIRRAPELHEYRLCKQEQQVLTGCNKVRRGELSVCSEDLKDMLRLLLSYFDEKEDAMICYMEDTCLEREVQMDHLTPTIIVCGKITNLSFWVFPSFFLLYLSILSSFSFSLFCLLYFLFPAHALISILIVKRICFRKSCSSFVLFFLFSFVC